MHTAPLGRAALAALLLLCGACDDDDSSGTPDSGTELPDAGQPDSGSGFAAGGTLTPASGQQVPASAKVILIWSVSSGSPDYLYKFGEGTSTGSTFELPLPAPPPAEALNNGELGVGFMLLMPTSFSLADGKYENEGTLFDPAIGAAGQYAIIYKAREQVTTRPWAADFPVGYSCGRGVEAPPSGGFDSFEPVPCSSIGVTVDDIDNIEFVNWT